ncbi:MAG: ComEC/Rec2 family competence protein, partial [Bacteroidota bacterium]
TKPEIIQEPKNPGEFDYKNYLASKNIFHSVYLKAGSFRKIEQNEKLSLIHFATKLKIKLLSILKSNFSEPSEFSIISALLLGYDDEISSDLSNAYAATGTIHVLSVSGLHVGIIYILLGYIFSFLDQLKYGKTLRFFTVISGIWFFAMLSGLSPSVVRAALMCSLFLFAEILRRQTQPLNTLLASAFLILYYDPYLILDIGFQLSYLALGGILIFQPAISKWLSFENKILNKIWSLTSVSLAAQLTTFPITIYYFNNLSLIFIISNLIVIPLSTTIMYGGMLLLVLSPFQKITEIISSTLGFLVNFMNKITYHLSAVPGAQINSVFINKIELSIVFIIIIYGSMFFYKKNKKYFFMTLVSIICLLVSLNLKYFLENNRKGYIIFNDKKNTSIEFFKGRTSLTIGSNIKPANLFRNKNHILKHSEIPIKENIIYNIEGIRFMSINNLKIKVSKVPNFIILRNNQKINIATIEEKFKATQIVFDGTNKFSKNLRWSMQADSLNLNYWSIRNSGALINIK